MDSGGKGAESNNIKAIANTTQIIGLRFAWNLMLIINLFSGNFI